MVLAVGTSLPICHGNNSETNPYVGESPDIDSTGLKGGHIDHVGPIWYPGAKADNVVWGDIIPPFDYDTGNGIVHFPGLNYTEEGKAILENGCVADAGINVEKTPSVNTLPDGGGEVTYTYAVTNTEQLVLSNVTVTDDKCADVTYQSGDTNSDNKLDLSETWTFTCTTTITETTTNTATATGHAGTVTVTDTAQATVTVLPPEDNPAVSIDKTADPETLPAGGGDVTYTYVVTNTGNVSIFDINVRDDNGTAATTDDFDVTCPSDTLGAGDSMTCTADVTGITEDTTNVATVTANWDDCHDDCSAPVPPATDDATVTVEPAVPTAPAIHVEKSASKANLPSVGGDVTYTYVVTNTGDVALTAVTVSDDKCDPLALVSGDTNSDSILDLTETWTYTCTATLTATTTNTALATGHDGDTEVTDTDQATVTVAPPGGGVGGETSPPKVTQPPTDTLANTTGGGMSDSLPYLLIVLGIIGFGAVLLTPTRPRR
jgi:uncharacterized repeat protein (TIGR01451 family)